MEFWFEDALGFWIYPILAVLATIGYTISTIGGGGGALILLPFSHFFFGVNHAAPVLNFGNFIGRPARLILFWKYIEWRIVAYYAPASIIGAVVGAYIFSNLKMDWLQIFVALFLISTAWQFSWGKKKKSFMMKDIYFIPLGVGVSFLSTIMGATGPVLNPFYMNAGIDKEHMIATKGANAFFMGIIQIGSYAALGELSGSMWWYGLSFGIGATLGNIIGKRFLQSMTKKDFRTIVIIIMVISGIIMLIKAILES